MLTIIYLSIVSDTSFPLETSPKGMTITEEPLSLLIHTLPPWLFKHSLSAPVSYMYFFTLSFLLTTDLPLLLGPSISFTKFSFQTLHSSFSQDDWTTSSISFHLFYYTPLTRFAQVPTCLIFHLHFNYFHPPTLSRHRLLSDNSYG